MGNRGVPRALPVAIAAAVLVLLTAGFVRAHDFWLVPDAFAIATNGEVVVRGQTSSAFPASVSAVTPDRITEARIVGAADDERIPALSTQGESLLLRHRPRTTGQKIVAVSVGWRHVKETAESFRNYLVLEGAAHALKHYDQTGQLPTGDLVRRYAKYAKTVVEVGEGPRAFDRVIGQPLEFVPLADPSAIRAPSDLRVRLLFQGKPLAEAPVHAGMAPARGQKAPADVTLTTSAEGIITIPAAAAGMWNVRAIHIVPAAAGADANWDVHWSTLVYRVK